MNNLYILSIAGLLGLSAASANISAQTTAKDTILNRQVYLEREYTPTIQDASKVNTLPALRQPVKKQYDIKFENAFPSINFASYPVGDTGSGDIKTEISYNKHRGYFTFGVGMYTNLEGVLGYRVIDNNNDKLDIFATHSSTDARIKYLQETQRLDKVKTKDMENLVKLRYSHSFESLTWQLSGSFLNDQYNYYGNPYLSNRSDQSVFPEELLTKKQSATVFEIETGIKSNEESDKLLYSGSLTYNRYISKYGPDILYDGAKANLIDAHADLAFPFMSDLRLGAKGGIFYQGVSDVKFAERDENPFHNLTVFNANPYISLDGEDFHVSVGVNFAHALDYNDNSQIAPTANISWNFEEKSMFYFTLNGGINKNNLVEIYRQNKYFNPGKRVEISQTPYDATIGVKSGVIKGFEFDLFGGYKYTKNEHLYVASSSASWGNISDALYANLSTGHFGGSIKTRLIPYTNLTLKTVGYFYNVKDYVHASTAPIEKKAWGQPSLTFDLNADFSFINNLILTANYTFEGGRKTYFEYASLKMDAINDLSFKANYQFYDWLSVYAKANNILNQKYERYYGYTSQGINILGGVSLKF